VRGGCLPTILVVEDEPVLAVALEVSLQRTGYTVLGPFAHLDAALAALSGPPIDAALLDVHLTRGDLVYALADRLQELGIPFGFMTAYETVQIAARYATHPCLHKPYAEADLLQLVETLLRPKNSEPVRDAIEREALAAVAVNRLDGDASARWKLSHAIALGLGIGAIAGLLTAFA
jgi:DNA-binding response OmpR family regulator